MFDIGFWEMTLVGLVGLIVIGPERLPAFVRLTGFWLGKARRTVTSVKQEIKEELYTEDLRQSLSKNSPTAEIENLIQEASVDFDNTVRLDSVQKPQNAEVQNLIEETSAGFDETVTLDSVREPTDSNEPKDNSVPSD